MNELDLRIALEAKQAEYKSKYDSYPDKVLADGQKAKDIPASDVEGLRALMDDVNLAGKAYEDAVKIREAREGIDSYDQKSSTPVNRVGLISDQLVQKSLADALIESDGFKSRVNGKFGEVSFDVDMKSLLDLEQKATMVTTSGFAPFVSRDGKVIPAVSRPPQFIDFLRVEPTEQNAVKFMKQTTRTNAADAKAENAALAESTIIYTEATVDIRKIGTFLPVTEEQLEDEAGVRGLIDFDLRLMVRQEADEQITVGSGTAPQIRGAYNATGVQSQALGSDTRFDAIMKAMTKVRVTGRARPNLIVLHSNDYQEIVLERTSDGIYLLGNPSDAPMSRVWGVNIALSEALTEGNGMVLDTDYLRLKLRKDVTLAVSDSHGELFIQNCLVLRAHMRAGLQIMRDEAICRLTGI